MSWAVPEGQQAGIPDIAARRVCCSWKNVYNSVLCIVDMMHTTSTVLLLVIVDGVQSNVNNVANLMFNIPAGLTMNQHKSKGVHTNNYSPAACIGLQKLHAMHSHPQHQIGS